MSEELENLDELDGLSFEIDPDAIPQIPHTWFSVFSGCTAFGFVMSAAVLSILQYAASRPYDLVSLSEQTARSVEGFLTSHNISPGMITPSDPILLEDPGAHYYQHDYSVQLPKTVKPDVLERLLNQTMTGSDLMVSDLIEGGVKQGVVVSFGEFVFANVRLIAPTNRNNYAALSTTLSDSGAQESAETPLPTITLPRINKAVLPPSSEDDKPQSSDVATPAASTPAPKKSSYTGWVPANRRASMPQPSTDAADDIELARIPSSDVPGLVIDETTLTPAVPESMVKLAIIVDDGGYGGGLTDTILSLSPKLTLSILPNTPLGTKLAEIAHAKGFEIMLHMPMENTNPDMKHPGQLNTDMSEDEITHLTNEALAQIPHAIGVNNHTGSKFTGDAKAMALFLDTIKDLDLYFIDSKTTPATRAYDISKAFGIGSAERDLFLDHDNSISEIRRRFKQVVAMAQKNGHAIAICHFRPNTASVLGELLLTLETEGVTLVHASELIQ